MPVCRVVKETNITLSHVYSLMKKYIDVGIIKNSSNGWSKDLQLTNRGWNILTNLENIYKNLKGGK